MTILMHGEKAFDNIQYSFTMKTLNKVRVEGIYLNIIKATYDKLTAIIIFNGGSRKFFF